MKERSWRLPPKESKHQQLADLRTNIDILDDSIAELLKQRLLLAQQIGELKAQNGRPVKDANREKEVIANVTAVTNNPVIARAIANVYASLLEESCAVQSIGEDRQPQLNTAEHSAKKETQKAQTLYFPRVLVIGVGLIGGALARQIKIMQPATTVVGFDAAGIVAEALTSGLIDEAETELAVAVKKASLILLCAPPQQNADLLRQMTPLVKRRQVIVDVTSTKSAICALAEKLPLKADFVGGHPLFGSHTAGMANSGNVRIDQQTFCLVPTRRTSDLALRRLIRWLSELGMVIEIATAEDHDETVAITSHLVQLLATTLGAMLADERDGISVKTKIALSGTGLQGNARLMNSPSPLWLEIIQQNKGAVCRAIDRFTQELIDTQRIIDSGANQLLCKKFSRAASFARALETQKAQRE